MIDHRIKTAGGKNVNDYFDDAALRAVYDATRGVPRDICILCDNAFVNGYVRDQRRMDEALIERTVDEMAREKRWPVETTPAAPVKRKSKTSATAGETVPASDAVAAPPPSRPALTTRTTRASSAGKRAKA